jgi:hypothetical protein
METISRKMELFTFLLFYRMESACYYTTLVAVQVNLCSRKNSLLAVVQRQRKREVTFSISIHVRNQIYHFISLHFSLKYIV